ncbi:MAG: adenylosuccinate synthetase [Bryobacterales bacterium]
MGSGGFATELHGPEGDDLRKAGFEFGTVTGRPRRCGWFDIPLARYASTVNALSSLVVTKLDVLDYLETIPVCVGYRYKGELLEGMPALAEVYEAVEPVYEERPGWATKTAGTTEFDAAAEGKGLLGLPRGQARSRNRLHLDRPRARRDDRPRRLAVPAPDGLMSRCRSRPHTGAVVLKPYCTLARAALIHVCSAF